jgi:hypothetical protein
MTSRRPLVGKLSTVGPARYAPLLRKLTVGHQNFLNLPRLLIFLLHHCQSTLPRASPAFSFYMASRIPLVGKLSTVGPARYAPLSRKLTVGHINFLNLPGLLLLLLHHCHH